MKATSARFGDEHKEVEPHLSFSLLKNIILLQEAWYVAVRTCHAAECVLPSEHALLAAILFGNCPILKVIVFALRARGERGACAVLATQHLPQIHCEDHIGAGALHTSRVQLHVCLLTGILWTVRTDFIFTITQQHVELVEGLYENTAGQFRTNPA
jgi:hypothetical protein